MELARASAVKCRRLSRRRAVEHPRDRRQFQKYLVSQYPTKCGIIGRCVFLIFVFLKVRAIWSVLESFPDSRTDG